MDWIYNLDTSCCIFIWNTRRNTKALDLLFKQNVVQ